MKLHTNKMVGNGFTLIEIAVSLFILTLVISAILGPMSVQIEERQVRESERVMNEMLEALVGFAITQTIPHLPCPDLTSGTGSNDGIEDRTGSACTSHNGNIPWATLGVNPTDAWGNRYRYMVTPAFSNSATAVALTSVGTIKVCTSVPNNDTSCGGASYAADNVPAVIISHGRNGLGGINSNSNLQILTPPPGNNPGASAHEIENAGGSYPNSVVSKIRTDVSGQEFDDIVVWLSPNVLFNRLVTANKLP